VAEAGVIYIYFRQDIAFLWLNFIGCALVMSLAVVLELFVGKKGVAF